MSVLALTDDLLDRAFRLAYFILGDRTSSIYVAMAALDRLKTAAIVQNRRLYYVPTGRSAYPASRTKVSLSQIHLLQRLIYAESEPFERLMEGREKSLGQHDMIIRFVKHLVRATIRHNSFYVALGLCRLLHNYSTGETIEIYNLVVQDPDRGKDDYYYRSRKKHLLREMKERFGSALKTYRAFRGEERFRAQEDSVKYVGLIRECLLRFMPWESSCILPAEIAPTRNVVSTLQFRGEDPDGEHEIELNRIHTLLHPDCFERIAVALGLDSPERRLEIPHFFVSGEGHGPTDDRLDPQALSQGELDAARRYLEKSDAHRRGTSNRLLSVLIDGDERVCFEAEQAGTARVEVTEGDEFISVRSMEADEAISLALHPLAYGERGVVSSKSSIMVGAGRRMSFAVRPRNASPDGRASATVIIDYRETKTIKAAALLLQRLRTRLSDGIALEPFIKAGYLKLALGSLLIAIFITGFLIYSHSKKAPPGGQSVAERKESDHQIARPSAPAPSQPQQDESVNQAQPNKPRPPEPAPSRSRRGRRLGPSGNSPQQLPDDSVAGGESAVTRGRTRGTASAALPEIKRVYIDPLNEGPAGGRVREALIQQLRSGGYFVVVESRDEADAVFKGSAKRMIKGGDSVSVSLRLVNAEGRVVWSTASGKRVRDYSGRPTDVAAKLVRDLLAEVRRQGVRR